MPYIERNEINRIYTEEAYMGCGCAHKETQRQARRLYEWLYSYGE